MSLYKFFESYVEETPELISIKALDSPSYENMYTFLYNKNKKLPIDLFFDMLFYNSFLASAKNLRQYEILKLKSRKIGSLAQKQFDHK